MEYKGADMHLKNVKDVLKEEDLVSLRCGEDENKLMTIYMDNNAKIITEFDENDGKTICYRGYRNGYLFVINDKKNKNGAKLIKLDSDLNQTVLYETDRILDADDFSDGAVPRDDSLRIIKDERYGCIDLDGNEIIKPKYQTLYPFYSNGLAVASNNKDLEGIINKKGEIIISFKYDELGYRYSDLIDSNGNHISCIWAANAYSPYDEYSDIIYSKYNKYALINDKGEIIIPSEYGQIILCKKPSKVFAARKGGLWGFVDINNHIVIPFEYEDVHCDDIKEDVFIVKKLQQGRKEGIIDCNGKVVIPCGEYKQLMIINENIIRGQKQNDKYVLLNFNNEEISAEYDILKEYRNNKTLFLVKNGDKFGYINQQGEVVIPLKYNNAEEFKGGIAIADNTVINEKGEVLYETNENTNIINLEVGIIAAERKDEEKVFDIIKLI